MLQFHSIRPLCYFIGVVTFFLVSACSTEPINEELPIIKVDFDESTSLPLSELVSKIEYVPLVSDLSYSQVFEDWMEIKIFNDDLYLFQDGGVYSNMFRFDATGKNVQTFNFITEGPGKVVNASDFLVIGDTLKMIDSYRSKMINYELSTGTYVGEVSINERFEKVVALGSNYLFYAANWVGNPVGKGANLYVTNSQLEVANTYLPIPAYLRDYSFKEYNFSNEWNKEILFKNILTDTLYGFSQGKVYPKYGVDLGKAAVGEKALRTLSEDNGRENRRNLLYNHRDRVFNFTNVFHGSDFVLLTTSYNTNFHYIFYNTQSKTTQNYSRINNDIDGSLVGYYLYWPRLLDNNKLYFMLPAEDVIHDIKYGKNKEMHSAEYQRLLGYEDKCDAILAVCTLKDIASQGVLKR